MTVRSDLIARLEQIEALLGVYSDEAPQDAPFPHVIVTEGASETALRGDSGPMAWRRTFQCQLFEDRSTADGTIRAAVVAQFRGYRVPGLRADANASAYFPDPLFPVTRSQVTITVLTTRAVPA